jgi:L-lysine exporter family protein LysE/ArgO
MQSTIFFLGLSSCLGLIVAIGAQNSFVLRQGLKREHVGTAVLVCLASDIALISLGVLGFGWLSAQVPAALPLLTGAGIVFLGVYGLQAAGRALRPASTIAQTMTQEPRRNRRSIALQAASFSWLNPHAWLDTTVLLGSLAQLQPAGQRWTFACGAASASMMWFVGLGLLARQLAPWFNRPGLWRGLDGGIALMMFVLVAGLVQGLRH